MPITQAKRYLRFYRCHGPYTFEKTSKVFIFNILTIKMLRVDNENRVAQAPQKK